MERTVYRRDPAPSLLRSYVLSSAEYERLIAGGIDPETVAESVLAQCAIRRRDHDDQDRIIMEISDNPPQRSQRFWYGKASA